MWTLEEWQWSTAQVEEAFNSKKYTLVVHSMIWQKENLLQQISIQSYQA